MMITPEEQVLLEKYANLSLFSSGCNNSFYQAQQDSCGNYHVTKGETGEKIQIIFQISPIGILPSKNKKDGYSVTIIGNQNVNYLADSLVYHNEVPVGILRTDKDEVFLTEIEDINSYWNSICVLKKDLVCKDDLLYGNELSSVLGLYFVDLIQKTEFNVDKCIDFTIWNSSLNGESGLISLLRYSNADKILFLSLISDDKNCFQGKGPALVIKDGNYILSQSLKNDFSCIITRENITTQSYVGKCHSAMEQLDIHAEGKPLLGFYLPVKHQNTKMEEINWIDVEKTRDVLLKCITAL